MYIYITAVSNRQFLVLNLAIQEVSFFRKVYLYKMSFSSSSTRLMKKRGLKWKQDYLIYFVNIRTL